jgi:hypothetical protein
LADFLARKDLADFLHEVLLDFLAYGFAHSVTNILSFLNIKLAKSQEINTIKIKTAISVYAVIVFKTY